MVDVQVVFGELLYVCYLNYVKCLPSVPLILNAT